MGAVSMITIQTSPIAGQKSGTSGLLRKTSDWMDPQFLENYTQCINNAIQGADDKIFIIVGDGRFYNTEAIQFILRILAGNGAAEVFAGQNGLLSTPAASHLIRLHGADGGFILSASHNPGGIDADFGLKYNMQTGSAAPE
jgi:phosphoglucomutase